MKPVAPGRIPPSAMIAVVLLAAIFRFTRLYWGLDGGRWFVDETEYVHWMARFRPPSWGSFIRGGLLHPPLSGFVAGLTGWLVSHLSVPVYTSEPTAIAVVRTIGAILSVVAVVVVARTGAAMYGPFVGVAAAAFLAVTPFEAMQVHYASLEPLLLFTTTLVLAASWRLFERGTVGSAVLAGAAVGLATGSKYTALTLAGAVVWAIVHRAWTARSFGIFVRLGVASALGAVVVFVLVCPRSVLQPYAFMTAMERLSVIAQLPTVAMNMISPTIGWWGRRWVYQLVAVMPYVFGILLALAAVVGLVVALRDRRPADRLLLAAIVPYYAYTGYFTNVYPRYMLPLFPALAILAAAGLARLARPRLAAVLALVVVGYGGALTASQIARFSWDQQIAVGKWLGARLPILGASERMAAVPGNSDHDHFMRIKAPIEAEGFAVTVQRPGQWLKGRPAFFVLPHWMALSIRRDLHRKSMVPALEALESGASGYRPVVDLPIPGYLQRPLDERLDPAFAVELWQGAIGLTIYAREDLLPRLATAGP
jgi:4-amino-4-deoxy-L-arabinose transferase-like glycosyltransferase